MTLPTPTGAASATGRYASSPRATRRTEAVTLLAMCLGAMMTFLQITASASALGPIQTDLHVSPADLVWIPSAYTLPVASLVLSAGTLGNLYGRRRMFVLGALIMIVGSLVVVFASTTGVVVAGQLVSGVGGALILPNSLALLSSAVPDPHRRTEMVTAWAAASGIGLAVGPLIAGELLDHFSWHAVFASNVVLGVITLAVAVRWVAESLQPGSHLDVPGQLLAVLTVAGLVYGLIEGGAKGYGSPLVVAAWALAAVGAVGFVLVERRVAAPMLELRLFSSSSFSAVMLAAAVSLFGFTGVAILSVLFYERVQHLSALQAGWRLLALFGVYVVVAYLTGRVIRRTGFKAPLGAGFILGGLATLGLVNQDPTTPYSHVWWLYVAFGAACGLVAAPSTAAALVSVPPQQAGMASGAVNMFRQVGSVLGTSLLGALLVARLVATLPERLAARGVPVAARPAVEHAVATGTTGVGPLPHPVTAAVNDSFTAGVHAGMAVTGLVFLATAALVLVFVHNRPHHAATAQ
jgi:EmrB/QacA subfamily drug resistance transporter